MRRPGEDRRQPVFPASAEPDRLSLRRIEAHELEDLWTMVRRHWRELMPEAPVSRDTELGRAYFRERYDLGRSESRHWWAMVGERRVGFAKVDLLQDIRGRWAHLHDYFIEPPWRRRGYGAAFARMILYELRRAGVGRVDLHVPRDNPAALEFWQGLGFDLALYRLRLYLEG